MAILEEPELQLRRRPTQQRSVATFEEILRVTGELLQVHGFDAFTTNLLADKSGISVRAIYRYFPNKHAIVGELARQMSAQRDQSIASAGAFSDQSLSWQDLWCHYIDSFVLSVRATPGANAVLFAMRSDPYLRRVDDEANQRYIDDIQAALTGRQPNLGAAESQSIATVLVRSTVAVLDEAFDTDIETASRLIATLKSMHLALLAEHLDDQK